MPLTPDQEALLHAITQGNFDVTGLIQPHRLTNNPRVDINTFKDDQGLTALHYAARYDRPQIIQLMFHIYTQLNSMPTYGENRFTPYHLAILYNAKNSIGVLHNMNGFHTDQLQYESLAKEIIKQDKIDAFRTLLTWINGILPPEILSAATGSIKEMLDYKPARRGKNKPKYAAIRDFLIQPRDGMTQQKLLNLIADQQFSSDEESSDSEIDAFKIIHPEIKEPIYTAILPNQKNVCFKEHPVNPNGECGFTALGITRTQLKECLMSLKENEEARENLALEIHHALMDPASGFTAPDDEWNHIYDLQKQFQSTLDDTLRHVKNHFPPLEQEKKGLDECITWLKEQNESTWVKALKDSRLAIATIDSVIKAYCKKIEVFERYIHELGEKVWLGYFSALLYAKHKKLSLYIWQKNQNHQLSILAHHDAGTEATNEIHMLHTDGFTHYHLLEIQNKLQEDKNSPQIIPLAAKFLLFRGVHFNPKHFPSTQSRREAAKESHHKRPVYSVAVNDIATTKLPKKPNGEFNYEKADELVKAYFEMLKITPDREERKADGKKNTRVGNFNSLYEHFIQAYINSYNSLFDQGGITRNFNFCINSNPILSTIPRAEQALKFVIGNPMGQGSQYIPRLRRSTNAFKHRRIGYLQVYALDLDSYQKDTKSVSQLANQGDISPGARREKDEVFFESSIPEKYILGYQVFSLPNFNEEWSQKIERAYGLTKEVYDYYKFNLTSNIHLVIQLIQNVGSYQMKLLERNIQMLREQKITTMTAQPNFSF